MPEPNGDKVRLRAYFDTETKRHKLEARPEILRIRKRDTRSVSMTLENETIDTEHYKPVALGYRIQGGRLKTASSNPRDVFGDCPDSFRSSFTVSDEGAPCRFTFHQHLGLEERPNGRAFSEDKPGPHAVIIRFTHQGWDDAAGSGDHIWWHTES